jgi:hypothetical protein
VLVGRNEELLEQVKGRLLVTSESEGEGAGHEVRVGDVGSVEFWRDGGKEVRSCFLLGAIC